MTFNEYQILAATTAKIFDDLPTNLTHAALGIATEAGEFTTEVKRAFIYGKPVDDEMRAHMVEELGDTLWYISLACEHLGVPLHTIAKQNIEKLQRRFPDKYSDLAALSRADKDGASHRTS